MNEKELDQLEPGDVIRNKGSSRSYVVLDNYGKRLIAIRTICISNPGEWDLILKAKHTRVKD